MTTAKKVKATSAAPAATTTQVQEIAKPTVGRTVLYQPADAAGTTNPLACIVVGTKDGLAINGSVFHNGAAGVEFVTDIQHKSVANKGSHYWYWPVIR